VEEVLEEVGHRLVGDVAADHNVPAQVQTHVSVIPGPGTIKLFADVIDFVPHFIKLFCL